MGGLAIGAALALKGKHYADKHTKSTGSKNILRDTGTYAKNYVKGMVDPRTYVPGKTTKEEVESIDEGKMDKMSLSHLWHAHAKHSYISDQGWGHGSGSTHRNEHAATAIENHVRKHHGNKVADDMVDHSNLHVAHAEYVGGQESHNVEADAAKLRAKHGIKGDLYGNE